MAALGRMRAFHLAFRPMTAKGVKRISIKPPECRQCAKSRKAMSDRGQVSASTCFAMYGSLVVSTVRLKFSY